MKNLKNSLTKILILFPVLFVFAACKKDKGSDAENFDATKYYITGEYLTSGGGVSSSYVYMFLPNAKTHESALGGLISETGSYTYVNGVLNIEDTSFNIVDENIISTNLPNLFKSYHLQKIPDADAFASKTFKGTVATNGLDNGKSCLIKFTTAKKFTVSIDGFAQTGSGADYTLQNNGVATANTGNEGRLHLMSMADGKLYYSQANAATNTHYYGLLIQQ